jgi:hypothetical protein
MRKTAAMELVELREGGTVEDLLLRELNAGKSYADLARQWKVTELTIARWVELYRIQRKVQWQQEPAGAGR